MAINKDPTMPQFIYPPNEAVGQALIVFNYIDTVNVSWKGSNKDLFSTELDLNKSYDAITFKRSSYVNVSKTGS